jgi:hypothetical protein
LGRRRRDFSQAIVEQPFAGRREMPGRGWMFGHRSKWAEVKGARPLANPEDRTIQRRGIGGTGKIMLEPLAKFRSDCEVVPWRNPQPEGNFARASLDKPLDFEQRGSKPQPQRLNRVI